jgi:hypothetical protein
MGLTFAAQIEPCNCRVFENHRISPLGRFINSNRARIPGSRIKQNLLNSGAVDPHHRDLVDGFSSGVVDAVSSSWASANVMKLKAAIPINDVTRFI